MDYPLPLLFGVSDPKFPAAGAAEQRRQAAWATVIALDHIRDTVSSGDRRMFGLSGSGWYITDEYKSRMSAPNASRLM